MTQTKKVTGSYTISATGGALITPASFVNGTSIRFNDVEDTVTLLYQSTGWVILALQNAVVS